PSLCSGEGIDRGGRYQPDGESRRHARIRRVDHSAHTDRDHADREAGGCEGEPRGRPDREVRGEVGAEMTSKERAARVEAALQAFRDGRMVILVDDEDRENEGDLTMAAEKVTPEAINFMAKYGRGLICLTMTEEKADTLELPLQSARKGGGSPFGTAFTVSIEARRGVTTGISAKDRATTILTAVAQDSRPEDLITPGHVFPLRAKRGGVLV